MWGKTFRLPIRGAGLEWKAVESSVLASVAYVSEEHLLFVEFRHTEEVYLYLDVPREEFLRLLSADSKGSYFNRRIRDRFRFLRLGLYRRVS